MSGDVTVKPLRTAAELTPSTGPIVAETPVAEVQAQVPAKKKAEGSSDGYEGLSNREVLSTHHVNAASQLAAQEAQREDPFVWLKPNTVWTFEDLGLAFQQLDIQYARGTTQQREELLRQLTKTIHDTAPDYQLPNSNVRLRWANANLLLNYLALHDQRIGFTDVAARLVMDAREGKRIDTGTYLSRRYSYSGVWRDYKATKHPNDYLTNDPQAFVETVQFGEKLAETSLVRELDGASAAEYAKTKVGGEDTWRLAEAYAAQTAKTPDQLKRLMEIRAVRTAIEARGSRGKAQPSQLGYLNPHSLRVQSEWFAEYEHRQATEERPWTDAPWHLAYDINRLPPLGRELLAGRFREDLAAVPPGGQHDYFKSLFLVEDLAQRAHELRPEEIDQRVQELTPAITEHLLGGRTTDFLPPLARIGERSPALQRFISDFEARIPEYATPPPKAGEGPITGRRAPAYDKGQAAYLARGVHWIRALSGQLANADDKTLSDAYGSCWDLRGVTRGDHLWFTGASALLKHARGSGARDRLAQDLRDFAVDERGSVLTIERNFASGQELRRTPGLPTLVSFIAVAKHSETFTLEQLLETVAPEVKKTAEQIWRRLDAVDVRRFEQVVVGPTILRFELDKQAPRHSKAICELAQELFELPLPGQRTPEVLANEWAHFVDVRLAQLADRLESAEVKKGSPAALAFERLYEVALAMSEAFDAGTLDGTLDLKALPEPLLAAADGLVALKNEWCTLQVVDSTTFGHDMAYAKQAQLLSDLVEVSTLVTATLAPPPPPPAKDQPPEVFKAPEAKGPPPKPVMELGPKKVFSLTELRGKNETPLIHLSKKPEGQARFLADSIGTFRLDRQWHDNDEISRSILALMAPPGPSEPVIDAAIASFKEGGTARLPLPLGGVGKAAASTSTWPLELASAKDGVDANRVLSYSFQAHTERNADLDLTRAEYLNVLTQKLSKTQYEALTRVPLATDPPFKVSEFIDALSAKLDQGLSLHGLLIEVFAFVNQHYGKDGETITGTDWPSASNELSLMILRRLGFASTMVHGYIATSDKIRESDANHWLAVVAPDTGGNGLALFNGYFVRMGPEGTVGAPVGLEGGKGHEKDALGEAAAAAEAEAKRAAEAAAAEAEAKKAAQAEAEAKAKEDAAREQASPSGAAADERKTGGTSGTERLTRTRRQTSGALWQRALESLKEILRLGGGGAEKAEEAGKPTEQGEAAQARRSEEQKTEAGPSGARPTTEEAKPLGATPSAQGTPAAKTKTTSEERRADPTDQAAGTAKKEAEERAGGAGDNAGVRANAGASSTAKGQNNGGALPSGGASDDAKDQKAKNAAKDHKGGDNTGTQAAGAADDKTSARAADASGSTKTAADKASSPDKKNAGPGAPGEKPPSGQAGPKTSDPSKAQAGEGAGSSEDEPGGKGGAGTQVKKGGTAQGPTPEVAPEGAESNSAQGASGGTPSKDAPPPEGASGPGKSEGAGQGEGEGQGAGAAPDPSQMLKPKDEISPTDTGSEDSLKSPAIALRLSAVPKYKQHRYFAVQLGLRRQGGGFREEPALLQELETHAGKETIRVNALIPPAKQLVLPGPVGASISRRGIEMFHGPFPSSVPTKTSAFKGGEFKADLHLPDAVTALPEMPLSEFRAEVQRRLGTRLFELATQADPSLPFPPAAQQMLGEVKAELESGALTIAAAEQLVSSFIEKRYVYDIRFAKEAKLEEQDFSGADGAHKHFSLIHAAPPPGKLGRGVCYQLNEVKLEMLRQLGIPALFMTGMFANKTEIGVADGHAWVGIPVPGKGRDKVRLFASDSSITPGSPGHASPIPPPPEEAAAPEAKQAAPKKKTVFYDPTPADLKAAKNFLGHLIFSGAGRAADPKVAGAFLRKKMDDEELRPTFQPKNVGELQGVWWLSKDRVAATNITPEELDQMMKAAGLNPAQRWSVRRVFDFSEP